MNAAHDTENSNSLWWLAAAPTIWFAHLLLSYATAAIVCAKYVGVLPAARLAVAIYTVLALLGIATVGWRNIPAMTAHDEATPADRRRFLAFTVLLLCGLSVVATIYVALAVAFIGNCR